MVMTFLVLGKLNPETRNSKLSQMQKILSTVPRNMATPESTNSILILSIPTGSWFDSLSEQMFTLKGSSSLEPKSLTQGRKKAKYQ